MFRQDYKINKIFLPFLKKDKKHQLFSREGVHPLRQHNSNTREKAFIIDSLALFSAKAELRFRGFIWKP